MKTRNLIFLDNFILFRENENKSENIRNKNNINNNHVNMNDLNFNVNKMNVNNIIKKEINENDNQFILKILENEN